jgi:hypothetical protein
VWSGACRLEASLVGTQLGPRPVLRASDVRPDQTNSLAPEPEALSPHSQEPFTGPYPEPFESTPHPPANLSKIHSNPPIYASGFRMSSFLWAFAPKPCKLFCPLSPSLIHCVASSKSDHTPTCLVAVGSLLHLYTLVVCLQHPTEISGDDENFRSNINRPRSSNSVWQQCER